MKKEKKTREEKKMYSFVLKQDKQSILKTK